MTWLTRIIPGYGANSAPILSVLAKRTYRYEPGRKATVDEKSAIDFFEKDEYFDPDNPFRSALKQEQELVAFKPLCDVMVHALAHPPKGKQAHHLDCGIKIGETSLVARVFGHRKVYVKGTGFSFSEPEPFEAMRIDYGCALGGASPAESEENPMLYPRNPVGKGFIVGHDWGRLQGLSLPNVEAIDDLLTPQRLVIARFEDWRKLPEPVAFGFVPRQSYPRWQLAGMNKKDWVEAEASRKMQAESRPEIGAGHEHLPPPARLLHPEFYCGANRALRLPHLSGGEPVKLRYLDSENPLCEFDLPGDRPALWIDVGRGRTFLPPVLQTVAIYAETRQCTLVWRGSAKYGGPDSLRDLPALVFGAEEA